MTSPCRLACRAIFSCADLLKACARTVSGHFQFAVAQNLHGHRACARTIPCARQHFRSHRFARARKAFKPRRSRRRKSSRTAAKSPASASAGAAASGRPQIRDGANSRGGIVGPCCPAPDVLPIFEPMPRPTRTLRWREPRGGFKFDNVGSMAIPNPAIFHQDGALSRSCREFPGVSARSMTCCMRRKPRPRIVCRMSRGQPIKLTTHLIFSVPDDFFVVAIFDCRGTA